VRYLVAVAWTRSCLGTHEQAGSAARAKGRPDRRCGLADGGVEAAVEQERDVDALAKPAWEDVADPVVHGCH
jgi:hypothetical protein